MAMYDPVTDAFTEYVPLEPTKVEIDYPIGGLTDISEWSSGISKSGIPLVKANTPESQQYSSNLFEEMAKTHGDSSQEIPQRDTIELNQSSQTQQASTSKVKQDLQGDKKKAMNFFISKGLNDYQAAGIVGNLLGESNLNHSAVNKSSGAYGLAQWLGDRKRKLFAKYGKNPTFDQQLEFLWEELNTSEKRSLNRLLQTKSAKEATNSFMVNFERPSKREMAESISRRVKFSQSLLS